VKLKFGISISNMFASNLRVIAVQTNM